MFPVFSFLSIFVVQRNVSIQSFLHIYVSVPKFTISIQYLVSSSKWSGTKSFLSKILVSELSAQFFASIFSQTNIITNIVLTYIPFSVKSTIKWLVVRARVKIPIVRILVRSWSCLRNTVLVLFNRV